MQFPNDLLILALPSVPGSLKHALLSGRRISGSTNASPYTCLLYTSGKFAYVVCEMKNYINVYSYDKNSDKDRFDLVQNIFTVRRDHKSNSAAANITFDSTGKHLLCSNAVSYTHLDVYKRQTNTFVSKDKIIAKVSFRYFNVRTKRFTFSFIK